MSLTAVTGATGTAAAAKPAQRAKRQVSSSTLQQVRLTFRVSDADGRIVTGKSLPQSPVTLFFFCGCDRCHATAAAWTDVMASERQQPGGASSAASVPIVIVFDGDAAGARQFAGDTGIARLHPLLLLDPAETLRAQFAVQDCPRAFILSRPISRQESSEPLRAIVYQSPPLPGGDDSAAVAPFTPDSLVAHLLTAARKAAASPSPVTHD